MADPDFRLTAPEYSTIAPRAVLDKGPAPLPKSEAVIEASKCGSTSRPWVHDALGTTGLSRALIVDLRLRRAP